MKENSSIKQNNSNNSNIASEFNNVQKIQEEIRKARANGDKEKEKFLNEHLKKFVINE